MRTRLPTSDAKEAAGLTRKLLARRPLALAFCLAMFAVEGLAGLVAPWMLGRIVDAVSTNGSRQDLFVPVAWILGAAVVGGIATAVSVGLLARVAEPALADLREQVLDRSLQLDIGDLEATGSGDLLSRVGDDVRLVANSFTEVIPLLLNSVIAVAFTVVGLFALDWRLGIAGLAVVPLYVHSLRWYLPRSAPYYRREREANGERAEQLLTGIHASRTLRAYNLAGEQQERIRVASWRSTQISLDVFRLMTRFFGRNNRAELIGMLSILTMGFFLVRSGASTAGAVTAAALFFHRLFNPIGALLTLFDDAQSAGASLNRLVGIALLPTRKEPSNPEVPSDFGITVKGLHHEYVAGQTAVDDVNLSVASGERIAIVGTSGAGKSTLGLALTGRLRPTHGSISLGGVPLERADTGQRPTVALVTQDIHVFSGTVRDNLALAAPDADDAELESALRQIGGWRAVQALPQGLDTLVGDGALALTPSLAQQLALARVLLADPVVAVLDEATAEAGSSGARDLEHAAFAATEGRTAIVIAHRLNQARDADRVLVMEAGRIIESGTHKELLASDGPYATLWAAWSHTR